MQRCMFALHESLKIVQVLRQNSNVEDQTLCEALA